MGNFGAEKAKNQGLGWQQGWGGGRIGESSRGKMGKNGGKWGKMGRKWGKMGDKWGKFRLLSSKAVWRPCFSPLCPC